MAERSGKERNENAHRGQARPKTTFKQQRNGEKQETENVLLV